MSITVALVCAMASAALCFIGLTTTDVAFALALACVPLAAGIASLIQRAADRRRVRAFLGPLALKCVYSLDGESCGALVLVAPGTLWLKCGEEEAWVYDPDALARPDEESCELILAEGCLTFRTSQEAALVQETVHLPRRCQAASEAAHQLLLEQI